MCLNPCGLAPDFWVAVRGENREGISAPFKPKFILPPTSPPPTARVTWTLSSPSVAVTHPLPNSVVQRYGGHLCVKEFLERALSEDTDASKNLPPHQ